MRMQHGLVLVALVSWASETVAGTYNQVLRIGSPAPAWTKLPGVDGKQHSLGDLANKEFVVVVFTCNSCPFAVDYEDRLIEFAKAYAGPDGKVALVAINVNRVAEDSLPKMQERAKAKGFNFPYLYDESQKIARDFGAVFTPEFFVLDKDRKVIYMGAMDDESNPAKVKARYVEAAVEAAIAGKAPAVTETAARGCMVRYAREKRGDRKKSGKSG